MNIFSIIQKWISHIFAKLMIFDQISQNVEVEQIFSLNYAKI